MDTGERNRRTLDLLRNWCAHVGIEKHGGTGIIEQMTGDPIGHHFVVCQHAAAGGMASWELAETAVAFHDANCKGCCHRVPVGTPNLSRLVDERDIAVLQRQQTEDRAKAVASGARAVRQAERAAFRRTLDPLQATVVDQIEALDMDCGDPSSDTLAATACLAPETFAPATVDYLFRVLEAGEEWATNPALQTLGALKADPVHLVDCAAQALGRAQGIGVAADLVAQDATLVSPERIGAMLPALIDLACPLRDRILAPEPEPVPGPLLALHAAHCRTVEAALETSLWSEDTEKVGTATRGILVLADADRPAAIRLARATVSALARARNIPDRQSGERDILSDLRRATADAFEHNPTDVDALMVAFQEGASDIGKGRVVSVYREILSRAADVDGRSETAWSLALRQLLGLLTAPMPPEVQREVEEAFQRNSEGLSVLAARHLDALLGAAALLDDRLRGPELLPAQDAGFLERIESNGRRSGLASLRNNLLGLAAKAAAGDLGRITAYLSILAGLPEDLEELRCSMVGHLSDLVTSPETLGAILPSLYSALVGSSVLARGRAARVVGQLSVRQVEDAPRLFIEAFVTLLTDPYVYPASSVVSALEGMSLPEQFDKRVAASLTAIVNANGTSREHSAFVTSCILLLIRSHLTHEQLTGRTGERLADILQHHGPKYYSRELRFLPKNFATLPGYGRLVIHALRYAEEVGHGADDSYAALDMLDAAVLQAIREDLLAMALASKDTPDGNELRGMFIEIFSRAGDWHAATLVAEHSLFVVPDTRRDAVRRLLLTSLLVSVRLEQAIAEGQTDETLLLAKEWRRLQRQLDENRR